MNNWPVDSIFYHIYPLGFCGAPERNDYQSQPVPRLEKISAWLDHLERLGVTALYLGPVFESGSHGYDTTDYYQVDRRLGDRSTLARLSAALHARGIRLVLDGVFNHVGRDFWAFRDVLAQGPRSPYCGWFHGLSFEGRSPFNDPFTYTPWEGHYRLVKQNLLNPEVREHLFGAIAGWMDEFQLDGLRLDVAYELELDFLRELSAFCRRRNPDFWLMGEVVHGDYRTWANPEMLDSVTNYECYKGLYSSLVDKNYFEIAYGLNRQFGDQGLYKGLALYNFADNHDVNRVASQLPSRDLLYPLYCLLYTMPGIPSLYYGSEWGIEGVREAHSDKALRPCLDLNTLNHSNSQNQELVKTLSRLAGIRREITALRQGNYRELYVSHQQFAFLREWEGQRVVVILNSAFEPAEVDLPLMLPDGSRLEDRLNPGESAQVRDGRLRIRTGATWGRILVQQS